MNNEKTNQFESSNYSTLNVFKILDIRHSKITILLQ